MGVDKVAWGELASNRGINDKDLREIANREGEVLNIHRSPVAS